MTNSFSQYLSFFFNDPATTETYTHAHTLSLHDAYPICPRSGEAEPGNRHGNRNINTVLANIDIVLEIAGRTAILCKDRHAVAVGIPIDEIHRFFQSIDANHA